MEFGRFLENEANAFGRPASARSEDIVLKPGRPRWCLAGGALFLSLISLMAVTACESLLKLDVDNRSDASLRIYLNSESISLIAPRYNKLTYGPGIPLPESKGPLMKFVCSGFPIGR